MVASFDDFGFCLENVIEVDVNSKHWVGDLLHGGGALADVDEFLNGCIYEADVQDVLLIVSAAHQHRSVDLRVLIFVYNGVPFYVKRIKLKNQITIIIIMFDKLLTIHIKKVLYLKVRQLL